MYWVRPSHRNCKSTQQPNQEPEHLAILAILPNASCQVRRPLPGLLSHRKGFHGFHRPHFMQLVGSMATRVALSRWDFAALHHVHAGSAIVPTRCAEGYQETHSRDIHHVGLSSTTASKNW
jgi:hypothetical protein